MNKKLSKTIKAFVEKNKLAVANGLDEENPYSGRIIVYEDSTSCDDFDDAVGSFRRATDLAVSKDKINIASFINQRASTAESFEKVFSYTLNNGWLIMVKGERIVHFLDAQIWGLVK